MQELLRDRLNPDNWFRDFDRTVRWKSTPVEGSALSAAAYETLRRTLGSADFQRFTNAWNNMGNLKQQFQNDKATLQQILANIEQRTGTSLGSVDDLRVDDLLDAIRRHGTNNERRVARNILKRLGWPADLDEAANIKRRLGRIAKEEVYRKYRLNPEEQAILDRIEELMQQRRLGGEEARAAFEELKDLRARGKQYTPYEWLMDAYREQALLDARYHAANILDMSVKMLLEGQWRGLLIAPSVFYRSIREGLQVPPDLIDAGINDVPAEIKGLFQRAVSAPEFKGGRVDWRRVRRDLQNKNYAAVRAELKKARAHTALGRIPGVGAVAGPLADLNQSLSMAVESSFRLASWYTVLDKLRRDQVFPAFLDEVERVAKVAQLPEEDATNLINLARQQSYRLTPEQIRGMVRQAAPGADDVAEHLVVWWQRSLNEASREAADQSRRIHFPIGDERVIEEKLKLRHWLPFHVWATRNVPYYVETLAHNPWLLRAVIRWQDLSEDERWRLGLTHRFKGKLDVGTLGFISFMVGRENAVWVNPTVAISLLEQIKPSFDSANPTIFDRILSLQDYTGLRVAPWFTLPLNALGYTTDADPPRFSRHTRVIQALTGIDPGSITGRPVRALRGQVSGILPGSRELPSETRYGSSHMDYLVNREIVNLSIEHTGRPDHPDYIRAMVDPTSPIHQEAYRRAMRERRLTELWNFVVPVPMAMVSPTEQYVRQHMPRAYYHIPRDQAEARERAIQALLAERT